MYYGINLTDGSKIPLGRYDANISKIMADINRNKVDYEHKIKFSDVENANYAFDPADFAYNNNNIYSSHYNKLEDSGGYKLRWKFMQAGGTTDRVKVNIPDGIIRNTDNLKFIITQNNTELAYAENSTDDIELTLMPPPTSGEYSILAVVKDDVDNTWHLAGRLDILARKHKTYNVTLVPLASGHSINKEEVRDSLNSTWNKYGISWEVDVDNAFYVNAAGDEGIKRKESINEILNGDWNKEDKWLSEYKPEQIAINRSYNTYASNKKAYSNETMYVFILPSGKAPYDGQIGDMPLKQQWGYLFVDEFGSTEDYRTLSHELGHGRTALPHTFKDDYIAKYTTNNLMDYVDPGSSPFGSGWEGATDLVRAQWDMAHNPAIFTPVQSDEDGAAVTVPIETINSWKEIFQGRSEVELAKISRLYDTIAVQFANYYNNCKTKDVFLDGDLKQWSVRKSSHSNKVNAVAINVANNDTPNYQYIDENEIYLDSCKINIKDGDKLWQYETEVALYSYADKLDFAKPKIRDMNQLSTTSNMKIASFKLNSNKSEVMHFLPSIDIDGQLVNYLSKYGEPNFRVDDYLILAFYKNASLSPEIVFQLLPARSNKDFELSVWLKYLGILQDTVKINSDQLKTIFDKTQASTERLVEVANAINKYSVKYAINTPVRMSHFLGQIGAETGGLVNLEEDFRYSPRRIVEIYCYPKYGHLFNQATRSSPNYSEVISSVNFNCAECNTIEQRPSEGASTFMSDYPTSSDVANAYADTLKNVEVTINGKKVKKDVYAQRTDLIWNDTGRAKGKTVSSKENNVYVKVTDDDYNSGRLRVKTDYIRNKAIFDVVYSCRMGNSTINSKEGSTYLGVGFIHLTGKETYQKVYDKWKLNNPNHETIKTIADFINALKTNVDVAIEASMIYWSTPNAKNENGNTLADQGNIDNVSLFVNGSKTNGADDRIKFTQNALNVIE